MTTVVNTPGNANGESSGLGIVVGVLIAILAIWLFIMYGLPAIRNTAPADSGSTNINVTVPAGGTSNTTPAPAY